VAQVLVLWGAPRTVSTAFERMMRERGDHEVHFEPFAAHYYFSSERRSTRFDGEVEPRGEHHLDAVLADLRRRAADRPVFVKDMAYHVAAHADESFLASFAHTFIVRHPRFALASLARIWPDFTPEEAGFGASRRLFDLVAEREGAPPPVIDGEDLLADPERVVAAWCDAVGLPHRPEALTWESGHAPGWQQWSPWTAATARTAGLPVGPSEPRDGDAVRLEDPRLEEAALACLADYRHLARHRLGA
jgi:hypothetical protein